MKTTKAVKTLRKEITPGTGFSPRLTITTRHLGGQGGLRHSLRGSGRIRKKKLMGNKFEFADKLKEKRNYILYVSGMGHETKEIEEIEDLPLPPPKEEIIEERQIIDNYQYHETKNIKKKNPRRLSITHHERLSIPFERTTLKRYSSYTTQPQPKSYTKTKSVKTTRFGKTTDEENANPFISLTLKQEKSSSVKPSNLYETYKPIKNYSFGKNTKALSTESRNVPSSTTYQSKTIIQDGSTSKTNISKNGDKRINLPKYIPLKQPKTKPRNNKSDRAKTDKNYLNNSGNNQTRTETTKEGDYLIKITTIKKPISTEKINEKYTSYKKPGEWPRGEIASKVGIPNNSENRPKSSDKPREGVRIERPGYGPKPGNRPTTFKKNIPKIEGPQVNGRFDRPEDKENRTKTNDKTKLSDKQRFDDHKFGIPLGSNRGPGQGERPKRLPHGPHGPYGGPRQGERQMGLSHRQRPGERDLGVTHGPYGGSRPQEPYEGPRPRKRPMGPPLGHYGPYEGHKPGEKTMGLPNGPHGPYGGQRQGERPMGLPHGPHGPRQVERPKGPHGSYLRTKPGDRPIGSPHGPYGGPRPERTIGAPHGPYGGQRTERTIGSPHGPYRGPRPEKTIGAPHGPYGGQRTERTIGSPHGPYRGPRPEKTIGAPLGPYGSPTTRYINSNGTSKVPRELFTRPRSEEKIKIESPIRTKSSYIDRTFTEENRLNIGSLNGNRKRPDNKVFIFRNPESQLKWGSSYAYKPSKGYQFLTEQYSTPSRKQPKIGGISQIRFQQTSNSLRDEEGDNYNYYEFKHVLKKGRKNLPITINHRRGENRNENYYSQNYEKSPKYSKIAQKIASNTNKTFTQRKDLINSNSQKGGIGQNNRRLTNQFSYKKITSTTKKSREYGGRGEGRINEFKPYSGVGQGSGKGIYSQYKKYEQKSKTGSGINKTVNYQINKSSEFRQVGNLSNASKYQFEDDIEYIIIDCPVHGRQTVRRNKLKRLGFY